MLAKMTVFSHVLDKSCDITVVGPKKLEDTRPMKVTYLLHGLTGNDANWVQYTQLPLWARGGNTLLNLQGAVRDISPILPGSCLTHAEVCSLFRVGAKTPQ